MIPEPMLAKLRELATKTCAFYWSDVHEPEEHKAAFETAMGLAKEAWELATKAERERYQDYLRTWPLDCNNCNNGLLQKLLNPKAPNHD